MPADEGTWRAVRERWELGETAYSLAKIYPITCQGIDQRAKADGWKRIEAGEEKPDNRENWFQVAAAEFTEARGAKDTPEIRGRILTDLSKGMPLTVACKGAGIIDDTFAKWRKDEPELEALCDRARAAFVRRNLDKVNDEGDANLAFKVLERHPMTRDSYAAPIVQPTGMTAFVAVDGRELARRLAFAMMGFGPVIDGEAQHVDGQAVIASRTRDQDS